MPHYKIERNSEILEIVSSSESFIESRELLKKEQFLYRIFPELHFNPLSSLVDSGKVIVKGERYSVPSATP